MFRKRLAVILTALLASLGFAAAVAAPAQATLDEENYAVPKAFSDERKDCQTIGARFSACVQPQGDYLWVKDLAVNGKPVHLYWGDEDVHRHGVCRNHEGVDAGWTYCNKNFTEGHTIKWRVKYYDNNDNEYISSYRYTVV